MRPVRLSLPPGEFLFKETKAVFFKVGLVCCFNLANWTKANGAWVKFKKENKT